MKKLILLLTLFFSTTGFSFDHSHAQLNLILQMYLLKGGKGGQTLFNYKKLKTDSPQGFKQYLKDLSNVPRKKFDSFTKDQQLAFLINTYNAFTLKLIVDNYPVQSIKDIGSLFKSPWKKKFFQFLGEKTHLDHVEHGMIRKMFNEPRIHFAVNCASIGCPSLMPFAFTANKLDSQLEIATKAFLGNKFKNNYNGATKTLNLSKIFKWYGGDFEKVFGSVNKFVAKYVTKDSGAIKLIANDKVRVRYLDYDWGLNEPK